MEYLKNILTKEILTIVIVKKHLDYSENNLKISKSITTFQSRFGPEAWLKPYTDKTLEICPKKAKKIFL